MRIYRYRELALDRRNWGGKGGSCSVSVGFNLAQLNSNGVTCTRFDLISYGFMWFQLISLCLPWLHLVSLGITCFHLVSLGFT